MDTISNYAPQIFATVLAASGLGVSGMGGYAFLKWLKKPTLESNREAIERAIIAAAELGITLSPAMRDGLKAFTDEHQRLRLEWPETRMQ